MVSGRGRGRDVAAILKDEDVDLLELDVAHMEADRVSLRKDPDNAGNVEAVSHLQEVLGEIWST